MQTGKFKTIQEYNMEECMRFLITHLPREASEKKPVLLHSMRVWMFLETYHCSNDTIIAGYLHDLIEDSTVTMWKIQSIFWKNVAEIVSANSKDISIEKEKRLKDSIDRCCKHWYEALLVKAADIIDNKEFYTKKENTWEQKRAIIQGEYLYDKIKNKEYKNHQIFNILYNAIK